MESIDYLTIISIAFLGSFSHCIGMCGGIVVAYSSGKLNEHSTKKYQALAHTFYSLGRITTYTLYGALFGFIGSVISFNNIANGTLLIFAGLVMILVGTSLGGWFRFLTSIEHSIQGSSWYASYFKQLLQSEYLGSYYMLGLLNGLLPCGLVYFFAISSASSASAIDGATIMFLFGLSTVPALFSLGFFVSILKNIRVRNIFMKITAISVVLYGAYTMYNGYGYIINPDRTLLECHI